MRCWELFQFAWWTWHCSKLLPTRKAILSIYFVKMIEFASLIGNSSKSSFCIRVYTIWPWIRRKWRLRKSSQLLSACNPCWSSSLQCMVRPRDHMLSARKIWVCSVSLWACSKDQSEQLDAALFCRPCDALHEEIQWGFAKTGNSDWASAFQSASPNPTRKCAYLTGAIWCGKLVRPFVAHFVDMMR